MAAQYQEHVNSNRRPRTRDEVARLFVECMSCGAYKVISQEEDVPPRVAVRRVHVSEWQLAGTRGHKNTRCRHCRRRVWHGAIGPNNRSFAENDPRYGMYSRGAPNPRPIQRSVRMSHPDNPPLDPLTATTIPIELLRGEALMAHVEAAGEYGSEWAPPDPLKRCTRCGEHAALYIDGPSTNQSFYCGPCGPRVSLFRLPIKPDDLRQVAADKALEQFEEAQQ